MRARLEIIALVFLFLLCGLSGCRSKPAGKRYELQGRVVGVDTGAHTLTVAHDEIPGLMKGMTMPFEVGSNDQWVFSKIQPGDQIHATLAIGEHAELRDISFSRSSAGPSDGTSALRLPQAGDPVPDFTLVNQDGKRIHLTQFRGRPLLLSFIYTRCPVPDFCMLMSNNFSEVLKDLQADPLTANTAQLLSISIDPEYDTPSILRKYGSRYNAASDPGFQQWQFASGNYEEVRQAADYFGLAYNEKYGQIIHNLSTALIGPDGRIVRIYTGNKWKPDEVATEYKDSARRSLHD